MALRSLLSLRTRVRQLSDMENSAFVTDTELNSFINEGAKKLYDILVSSNEDYNTEVVTFNLTSSSNKYLVPTNCYKIRGVDIQTAGKWIPLRRFNFGDRGASEYTNVERATYRLIKEEIYIQPESRAPGTYRLWYVPELADLVADTDTLDGKNGFEEYVVFDAAIKCRIKEESDTRELEAGKQEALQRVKLMSEDRDYGAPDVISDVRNLEEEYFYD